MGIWVGRYAIAGGEVLEHGPWFVDRRRVHDGESVRLLILAEPVDERSSEFCHEVADAIAALFRRESLSLTGGLLRALRQAHANLAEWNRRSLREHRVAVGITCVAIRDNDATVAQLGPSNVYVREGNRVRRLQPEGAAAQPLGGPEAIEPLFNRIPLSGRELLLLTTNVEQQVGLEAIIESLSAGPERALADLFRRTRALPDMTAVLIADLPHVIDEAPEPEVDIEPAPVVVSAASAPRRVDSGMEPEHPLQPRPRPAPAPTLRRPRSAGSSGARRSLPRPPLPGNIVAMIGAGILLAVVAAWFLLPPLLNEDRDTRFRDAVTSAQTHLDNAGREADVVKAREELRSAQADLARARTSAPAGDTELAAIEQRAEQVAAVLDRAVDVSDLRTVLTFEGTLTAPLQASALVGTDPLWLLERERGRVFSLTPGAPANPRELYRSGEQYDGATAREPLALAWDQQGRRLLLIDAQRTLWSIGASDVPTRLPVRGIADLKSITAISVYAGNLYILDAEGGEVWRYLPAGAGYDSERTGLLGSVSLVGATSLAVDGDIFVLDSGSLRHFRLGTEQTPLFRGIDRAPAKASALAEDVRRGRFYVADPDGRRVVVSDRGGLFIGQFRHPAFFDLRGLALSDDGGTLYALTGSGIFALDPLATP